MFFFLLLIFSWNVSLASAPWPSATLPEVGVDTDRWKKFVDFAFSKKESFSTNVLFVLYKGRVIHHSTANGFTKNQIHRQWSVTKSITSLLFGIAKEQGILGLETPVTSAYPKMGKEKQDLRAKHLLEMTSGIRWNEGYKGNPILSDVVAMLYTSGYQDMAQYFSKQPLDKKPGEHFQYASGNSNLLMAMLKNKLSKENYDNFPWQYLFDPLAIDSATWEKDQSGNFVGSSYLYMTPVDLAKIGFMVLNRGKYFDRRIVSADWIDYSMHQSKASAHQEVVPGKPSKPYGAHWWLNQDLANKKDSRPYKSLPEDAFMALGYQGQIMLIVPSKQLIVVRNAADRKAKLDKNKFFTLLMEALP